MVFSGFFCLNEPDAAFLGFANFSFKPLKSLFCIKTSPLISISSGKSFDKIILGISLIVARFEVISSPSFPSPLDNPFVNFPFKYVKEAEIGDVLAVDLLDIQLHDYGWQAIVEGFGFLTDRFPNPKLNIHEIDIQNKTTMFNEKIKIPLNPFPGVMGVAPDTEEMLSTIPPRANGGNMDDPSIVKGTTVYFPVFVKGALFSIGDAHAVQGLGEVCGTAIESPMTFTYRLRVLKNKPAIQEPQYETNDYYAVTGFGATIDLATKKAVNYMVDHLSNNYDISPEDAYMLCSLVGDLKIAEVVDVPNMLVTMHFPKSIINQL